MAVGALAGIAGGLEEGMQQYQQGQLFKEQLAGQKIQNEAAQSGMAEKVMPYYQMLARQNPAMLTDPTFIKNVNTHLGPLGVQFDASKGIPKEFTDPTFLNPDLYLKNMQMGQDAFTRGASDIMYRPGMTPIQRIAGLKMLAKVNHIDPATLNDVINNQGLMTQMQEDFSNRQNDLRSRAGLNEGRTKEISALLPYRISNDITKDLVGTAEVQNYQSLGSYRSSEVQLAQQRIDQNGSLGMLRIGISAQDMLQKGATVTEKQRQDFFGNATTAAKAQHDLAVAYLGELNTPSIVQNMTPQQIKDAQDSADNALNAEAAITQKAADVRNALPAYKPPTVPSNMQVAPRGTPGKATAGVPYDPSSTQLYFITQGPNRGKYVYQGKMSKYANPSKHGETSQQPYTPASGDVYTPANQ